MEQLLLSSLLTPIASLSPNIEHLERRYVRAVVILLWPYSSSTKQCGLLLSEPDFRLRGLKGQIKAIFHNGAAEAVARSKIAIGDIICLSLDRTAWKASDNGRSDPVHGTEWDIEFSDRVLLEVYRESKHFDTVDFTSITIEPLDGTLHKATSQSLFPVPRSPSPLNENGHIWSSPAFARSLPTSMITDGVEEDGFMLGRGRKRTKFGRLSSEWVFLDSPPSPIEIDTGSLEDGVSEDSNAEDHVSTDMPSPPVVTGTNNLAVNQQAQEEGLHPTPNPSSSPNFMATVSPRSHDGVTHVDEIATSSVTPSLSTLDSASSFVNARRTASEPEPAHEIVPTISKASKDQPTEHTQAVISRDMLPENSDIGRIEKSQQSILDYQESISRSPVLSIHPPYEVTISNEGIFTGGNDSTPSPGASEDVEEYIRSPSIPVGDSESGHSQYWSEPAAEATMERDLGETVRLESAWAESWDDESEVPTNEEIESVSSRLLSNDEVERHSENDFGTSIIHDDFKHEMPTGTFNGTPYPQEVIVLDSDDSESDASHSDVTPSNAPQDGIGDRFPEESASRDSFVSTTDVESEPHQRAFSVVSMSQEKGDSDSEPDAQEGQNFIRTNEIQRWSRSASSASESVGDIGESSLLGTDSEISPESKDPVSHADSSFAIDPALFLDGAGADLPLERPIYGNIQTLTPRDTQETCTSHYQPPVPTARASHVMPTPEISQETQISRPSFSSLYGTETEPTFNSVLEGSLEGIRPNIAEIQDNALQSPNRAIRKGAALLERDSLFDDDAPPKGTDAEDASHRKASTQDRSLEPSSVVSSPIADTPIQHHGHPSGHTSGFRTKLSYFCPLSLLAGNFHQPTDTISAIFSVSPVSKARGVPSNHFITLHITDSSMAGDLVCAQVFCKSKTQLPVCTQGDIILLRNFKVQSIDHKMMLNSMDDSSWAVFVQGAVENVQMNGAPVEFAEEERAYVAGLRQWYLDSGAALVAKKMPRSGDSRSVETSSSIAPSESGSTSSRGRGDIFKKYRRKRKSTPRLTVHELRGGRRYLDVGSPSDKESIHELRDGTAVLDTLAQHSDDTNYGLELAQQSIIYWSHEANQEFNIRNEKVVSIMIDHKKNTFDENEAKPQKDRGQTLPCLSSSSTSNMPLKSTQDRSKSVHAVEHIGLPELLSFFIPTQYLRHMTQPSSSEGR
ncbi:predicted protein [Uncinocarpus reesii 1704]|uniref:Telomeric single stranded DNA binding POT1/Cdc13 domain-containing protein n=1 Tax=Uncinocarpus reesii (strain UAMH 1704) TaxID=336963 RepID=C4JM33_UNCRE|nr:uncharacterized protein UREG_03891 [Uncinocarpus reesii 1704]EEP79045.1 predicted protein [Uncinocarpus reesii 1704]